MSKHRVYTIAVDPLSLTISRVYLDGDPIGTVEHFTTARRPKVWFPINNEGELITEIGPFVSEREAAFALALRAAEDRTKETILATLGKTPA